VAELETRFSGIALRGSGRLRVGTLPSAGAGLMPGTLASLIKIMPSLDIQLVQGRLDDLLPLLRTGSIEILIGRLYPTGDDQEFSRRVLYDEPFSLLVRAGHPLTNGAMAPSIDALRRFRFILPTENQRMTGEIQAWFANFGMTPEQTVRSNASATMRELLLAGDDILALPALMVAGDIIRGTIQALKMQIPSPLRPGGLLLRHGVPLSEAARNLLKALRTQIRILAEAGFVAIR
jgi:LysR family pca operon transcriptional activator